MKASPFHTELITNALFNIRNQGIDINKKGERAVLRSMNILILATCRYIVNCIGIGNSRCLKIISSVNHSLAQNAMRITHDTHDTHDTHAFGVRGELLAGAGFVGGIVATKLQEYLVDYYIAMWVDVAETLTSSIILVTDISSDMLRSTSSKTRMMATSIAVVEFGQESHGQELKQVIKSILMKKEELTNKISYYSPSSLIAQLHINTKKLDAILELPYLQEMYELPPSKSVALLTAEEKKENYL